jgi:hypothetical protein
MIEAQLNPSDLSPGDRQRSMALDLEPFQFRQIRSQYDPLFRVAYNHLWKEFGEKHEIEAESVLVSRLANTDPTMRYELIFVQKNGVFAAVRDHTAIVSPAGTVVHLSHLLIDTNHRRTGLAGWLRALPVTTARLAMTRAGVAAPITLVGEMEPPDVADPATQVRLQAYERAGFSKLAADYLQPDFRPPAEIDAAGGPQPLRMSLILRRVGRESETSMPASEVRHLVQTLYRMYARNFREPDLAPNYAWAARLPTEGSLSLVPPTA